MRTGHGVGVALLSFQRTSGDRYENPNEEKACLLNSTKGTSGSGNSTRFQEIMLSCRNRSHMNRANSAEFLAFAAANAAIRPSSLGSGNVGEIKASRGVSAW